MNSWFKRNISAFLGRKKRMDHDVKMVMTSSFFDFEFYTRNEPGIQKCKKKAARHFVVKGGFSGKKPSQLFDSTWYLRQYPDVACSGMNPLVHYLKFGIIEGRFPFESDIFRNIIVLDELFVNGKGKEAIDYIDNLSQECQLNPEICFRKSRLLFYQSRYSECLAIINLYENHMMHKVSPHLFDETCRLKCQCLLATRNFNDARVYFLGVLSGVAIIQSHHIDMVRKTISDSESFDWFKNIVENVLLCKISTDVDILLQLSLAARDNGRYQDALEYIKKRYVTGMEKPDIFGSVEPVVIKGWTDKAELALLDLREDLNKSHIDFFLISGTLLGCAREGRLLSHDKDIDIGVFENVKLSDVSDCLRVTGRFLVLTQVHDRLMRLRHANGVMIDVFVHWEDNQKIHHHGQKTGWWNTPFDLNRTLFLQHEFLVPNNVDLYLTENYGDWRIPKEKFDTFTDTKNLYITNEKEMIWYCYKYLLNYFMFGDSARFDSVKSFLAGIESN